MPPVWTSPTLMVAAALRPVCTTADRSVANTGIGYEGGTAFVGRTMPGSTITSR
jgi:hypothetical protein